MYRPDGIEDGPEAKNRIARNLRSGEFAQIVTPIRPRLDWVQELRELARWADATMDKDYTDRQMIAEYMVDTINRILCGEEPRERPF